ncbi:MAG: protein kinase [bacterium]
MFKNLYKKIKIFTFLSLFIFISSFSQSRSLPDSDVFKKHKISGIEEIYRGHEKIVYEVEKNGERYACLYFVPNYKNLGRHVEKFKIELDFFKKFKHRNILSFVDAISENDTCFILTELADDSLINYIDVNKDIPFLTKIKILKDIALGLEYLHSTNMVHCDLKPENVVIFKNDDQVTAKLIDFTYSKEEGLYSYVGGTARYMAPENLQEILKMYSQGSLNLEVTTRSDIFSFGLIMYVLFYKKDLDDRLRRLLIMDGYDGRYLQLKFNDKRFFKYICKYISTLKRGLLPFFTSDENDDDIFNVNDLIKRCLAYDPEKRPTASEILEELELIEKKFLSEVRN